jgi:hypothetical protein
MALHGRATYVHLGRMSAMILVPSMPRLFEARLRLVMALLPGGGISRYQDGIFSNLRALGKEGTNHDCPRHTKTFLTEVRFYHRGLHGDWLAITAVTAEREL